jgi:RimJ/RimL family protein N-acetyltransferase
MQTARLDLRPYAGDDFEALFGILANPAAMRFFGPARPFSRAEAREYLEAHARLRAVHGFAPWSVRLRETGRVVGWGGLLVDPFEEGWGDEVGYILHSSVWGRGLATELVRAAVSEGFERQRRERLCAYVRPANLASARVLEKCAFHRLRYEPRLERDRWEIRAAGRAAPTEMPRTK